MAKSDLLSIEEYSADEFVKLTWEQYGKILDKLVEKIDNYGQENNVTFDVIVPILRGGGVAATALAIKLKTLRIIPVQYKYFIHGKQVYLKRLLPFPKNIDLGDKPNILVVENCYCFGTTTKCAVEEIRKLYPKANIYVAADRMDYTYQKVADVVEVFYGELDNDTKKLSPAQCKEKGIDPLQYFYPWESLDEEMAACQLKQYPYNDLKQTEKSAKTSAHFDFSK